MLDLGQPVLSTAAPSSWFKSLDTGLNGLSGEKKKKKEQLLPGEQNIFCGDLMNERVFFLHEAQTYLNVYLGMKTLNVP